MQTDAIDQERAKKMNRKIYGYVIGNTFNEKVAPSVRQRCSDLIKGYGDRIEYMEVSLLEEANKSKFMDIIDRLVCSIVIRVGGGVWL